MYTIVNLATYRQFTNAAPVTLDSNNNNNNNNNNKHGNVFKTWLCPNFLLLPKKSELPKIGGRHAYRVTGKRTSISVALSTN